MIAKKKSSDPNGLGKILYILKNAPVSNSITNFNQNLRFRRNKNEEPAFRKIWKKLA